jgi:hypothetical protein
VWVTKVCQGFRRDVTLHAHRTVAGAVEQLGRLIEVAGFEFSFNQHLDGHGSLLFVFGLASAARPKAVGTASVVETPAIGSCGKGIFRNRT